MSQVAMTDTTVVRNGERSVLTGQAALLVALVVTIEGTINDLPAGSQFTVEFEGEQSFGIRLQRGLRRPEGEAGRVATEAAKPSAREP